MPLPDVGRRYTRLVVLRSDLFRLRSDGQRRPYCLVVCDCGVEKEVRVDHLVSGLTVSCGCLGKNARTQAVTTHGSTNSRLYIKWCNMLNRCYNLNNVMAYRYSGRGIEVCTDWDSFEPFRDWSLANGYEDGLTLDRINNDGNYEPSNCRWITSKEQYRNRSDSHRATVFGETKTLIEWSEDIRCVVSYKTLHSRVTRDGWDYESAITTPKRMG